MHHGRFKETGQERRAEAQASARILANSGGHNSGNLLLLFRRYRRLLIDVTTLPLRTLPVRLVRPSRGFVWWIPISAVLSVVVIVAALWNWGAKEVRGDPGEVSFLAFIGAGWLLVAYKLFPWFGLSIRDDVLERKNPAAAVALSCALLSVAITFAAGNLGEGPSYWENIFCGGLATGGLLALWFVVELAGNVSAAIAEERDFASGLRFGAALLAWGLILGRAATGNWHSPAISVHDFLRDGWVAAVIALAALVIQFLLRPSSRRPFPSWPVCGLLPALFYLALAAAWVWHLGRWEGMPE
jgi:uncharacterized membrane protein YjfL (UPF0719 family)